MRGWAILQQGEVEVQEDHVSHSSEAKTLTPEVARAEQREGPREEAPTSKFSSPPALCCKVRPSFRIKQLPGPLSPPGPLSIFCGSEKQATFSQKNLFRYKEFRRAESSISLKSGMGLGRARRI